MLSIRDPPQNKRSTQFEREGTEKNFQANRHKRKDGVAIFISDKIDFKAKARVSGSSQGPRAEAELACLTCPRQPMGGPVCSQVLYWARSCRPCKGSEDCGFPSQMSIK